LIVDDDEDGRAEGVGLGGGFAADEDGVGGGRDDLIDVLQAGIGGPEELAIGGGAGDLFGAEGETAGTVEEELAIRVG
jgi:hypothetical protein